MGVYKIGDKWYVDLYIDGRRKRKAIGSRKEAENALTAIKADVLRGEFKFKRENKVHFEAFAQDYLSHCKTNKKKSWQRDENSIQFLEVHFGGMILSKITPLDIEDYKAKRINGEIKLKPKPGASRSRTDWRVQPATINRELACLKHMFSLAKKWKMADENPVKEVQFFQERQIEMKILSREEIGRLLDHTSPRLKPIVIVALNTGMRKGEILHLRWSDIDFDNKFIFLKETKSNRFRKIPMSGLVVETLRTLKRDKEFVFTNPRTGRPLSDLQAGFKAACRKGIAPFIIGEKPMKKGLTLALILIASILLAGFGQVAQSAQTNAKITGAELLKMLRSSSSGGVNQASSLIGEIYGPKLNNGIIPDSETLYGLGRILMDYMTDHPASQARSVEQLVMEVLKDAPLQIEEIKAFWANAYKVAEAYFSQPSPENAEKLYMALPDKRLPSLDFKGQVRLVDLIFNFGSHFSLLEKSMEDGDPLAIDVAFRLINISDGASGEDLDHAIGEILPKHPRLFLQKLLAHRFKTEPEVFELLESILNPVGWWEIPEDDNNLVKYKELLNTRLALRIKALESVNDPELKEIRDFCLAELRKKFL